MAQWLSAIIWTMLDRVRPFRTAESYNHNTDSSSHSEMSVIIVTPPNDDNSDSEASTACLVRRVKSGRRAASIKYGRLASTQPKLDETEENEGLLTESTCSENTVLTDVNGVSSESKPFSKIGDAACSSRAGRPRFFCPRQDSVRSQSSTNTTNDDFETSGEALSTIPLNNLANYNPWEYDLPGADNEINRLIGESASLNSFQQLSPIENKKALSTNPSLDCPTISANSGVHELQVSNVSPATASGKGRISRKPSIVSQSMANFPTNIYLTDKHTLSPLHYLGKSESSGGGNDSSNHSFDSAASDSAILCTNQTVPINLNEYYKFHAQPENMMHHQIVSQNPQEARRPHPYQNSFITAPTHHCRSNALCVNGGFGLAGNTASLANSARFSYSAENIRSVPHVARDNPQGLGGYAEMNDRILYNYIGSPYSSNRNSYTSAGHGLGAGQIKCYATGSCVRSNPYYYYANSEAPRLNQAVPPAAGHKSLGISGGPSSVYRTTIGSNTALPCSINTASNSSNFDRSVNQGLYHFGGSTSSKPQAGSQNARQQHNSNLISRNRSTGASFKRNYSAGLGTNKSNSEKAHGQFASFRIKPNQSFASTSGGSGFGGASSLAGGRGFLETNEIADISADYMRINGAFNQFKGLLGAGGGSFTTKNSSSIFNRGSSPGNNRVGDASAGTINKQASHQSNCNNSSNSIIPKEGSNSICSKPSLTDDLPLPGGGGGGSGSIICQISAEFPQQSSVSVVGYVADSNPNCKHPTGFIESTDPSGVVASMGTNVGVDKWPISYSRQRLNISYRLGRRKELFDKRRKAADYALVFALMGIFMMILENELTGSRIYLKGSAYSNGTKLLITLSTALLLLLIVAYHALEIQLFLIDNSAEDWRIALTGRRVAQMTLELLVCAICPIPGDIKVDWTTVHADGKTVTKTAVSLDVLLSIPMFLRVYLICRVLLLHSKLFTDASSRSIGALNRINFNTKFVMKNMMTVSPGTVLCVVTFSFWIVSAWILRLCERHHTMDSYGNTIIEAKKHENYLNSLWLIAITFLSVGYGDIVPNTYCGRTVAVLTGILGAGTSSLVVAVIARKLELSRAEKHVHNFMLDNELTKRLKHTASNVLRETWLIYKTKKSDKVDSAKLRLHQRKFLMAIYELRKVKRDQRKLAENSLTVADIAKTATSTYEIVSNINCVEDTIESRLTHLEDQVTSIQTQLHNLPDLIVARLATGSPYNNINPSPPPHNPPPSAGSSPLNPFAGLFKAKPTPPKTAESNRTPVDLQPSIMPTPNTTPTPPQSAQSNSISLPGEYQPSIISSPHSNY